MIVESKLQEYLAAYKQEFVGKIWPDEKYKWVAVKCFKDNWNIDAEDFPAMLKASLSKTGNLLQNSKYARSMIEELASNDTGSVRQMFRELFDENDDLYSRIEKFKNEATKLCSQDKSHYQDENTISIYLWLKYPDKYCIYKIGVLKDTAGALSFNFNFIQGHYADNINNYMRFYDEITNIISKDEELVDTFKKSVDDECYYDPQLKTLTIDVMYYISKHCNKTNETKEQLTYAWFVGATASRTDYVDEFVSKGYWQDFHESKNVEIIKGIKVGDHIAIKSNYTRKNNLPFQGISGKSYSVMAIKAIGIVTENDGNGKSIKVEWERVSPKREWYGSGVVWKTISLVKSSNKFSEELLNFTFNKSAQNYAHLTNSNVNGAANEKVGNQCQNDFSKDLLQSKNIIFRGAPGTGKTFLAKQIAADIITNGESQNYDDLTEAQKEQIEFVQFHPSYDYTDFVEGLRPKLNNDGSMGFELQDGIFKRFCTRAKINIENSRKNLETAKNETIIDDGLNDFFSKLNYGKVEFTTTTGNAFSIDSVDDEYVRINVPNNPKTNTIVLNLNMLKSMLEPHNSFEQVKDVTTFFKKKYGSQEDSYYFAIYNVIKKDMKKEPKEEITIEERKDYIFIIDEINRGEISKIFGELFFSIDPEYRGSAGEVSTQYANLHSAAEEKFYVPENVYVIGTMNDIDRSVDSFDFAMRRRFRFIELKANEQVEMLDSLEDDVKKDEAKQRMINLNNEIAKIPELDENYQIGAAYFMKISDIKPNAANGYNEFNELWDDYLQPLLQEYLHGMPDEKDKMTTLKKAYNTTSEKTNNTTSEEAENGENSQG